MSNMEYNNYTSYPESDNYSFDNPWQVNSADNAEFFEDNRDSSYFNDGYEEYASSCAISNSNDFVNSSTSYVPKQSGHYNSKFGNSAASLVPKQSATNYGSSRNQGGFAKKRVFSQTLTNQNQANANNNDNKQPGNYATIKTFRQHFNNRQNNGSTTETNSTPAPTLFMGRDPSYPEELNNLMNPFFCGVCNARLNSIKSANIHYESKAHDKHLTPWLKKTFSEKGLEPPEIQRFVTEQPSDIPVPFHCELCKLDLTSAQHALQHYNGKRHRQSATKIAPITGIGYFNVEGKWVETGKVMDKVTGKETSYILVNTPSGFEPVVLQTAPAIKPTTQSQSEITKNPEEPPAKKANVGVSLTETSADKEKKDLLKKKREEQYKKMLKEYEKKMELQSKNESSDGTKNNQYKTISLGSKESAPKIQTLKEALDSQECKICLITTTSNDQMLLHLKGKRHTKKLKAIGEPPTLLASQNSKATILECLENNSPSDISMYRTPTGSYYCKSCNTALEDVAGIKRHIMSKTHLAATKKNDV